MLAASVFCRRVGKKLLMSNKIPDFDRKLAPFWNIHPEAVETTHSEGGFIFISINNMSIQYIQESFGTTNERWVPSFTHNLAKMVRRTEKKI